MEIGRERKKKKEKYRDSESERERDNVTERDRDREKKTEIEKYIPLREILNKINNFIQFNNDNKIILIISIVCFFTKKIQNK